MRPTASILLSLAFALASLSACEQKKSAKAEADEAKDAPQTQAPKEEAPKEETLKAQTPEEEDTEAHAHAPGVYAFDADLMSTALSAKDVSQVRMYFGEGGAQRKTAVYHLDASKVPAPVLELAKKQFPDATVTSYELEKYAALGVIHEVEVNTKDGSKAEVAARADGTLVYVETVQKPSEDVPKAPVRAAVEAAVPGAQITAVEVKDGPNLHEYRVKATLEGQQAEHVFVFDKSDQLTARYMRFPAKIELPVQ
ncbi:MAG: hypothetical protein AAGI01_06625 [Myxococcota bacterium]